MPPCDCLVTINPYLASNDPRSSSARLSHAFAEPLLVSLHTRTTFYRRCAAHLMPVIKNVMKAGSWNVSTAWPNAV